VSHRKTKVGALLVASVMAVAVATDAQARGFGGFGGGHFGGGGMHFGGGGMHFGGLGGMHFGGMHFGGMHLGGMRLGGARFGGLHFGGHGLHVAHGTHLGGHGYASHRLGAHHFAGSAAHSHAFASRTEGRSATLAARTAGRAAAAAGAVHIAGSNFAHNGFGPGWRGRFPHPFPGFRGWWGSGWYGPVFWPFAYDVLLADLFWPWFYDDAFWAYGYPDLYGGVFWPYGPYGYEDLAGYLTPGPGSAGGAYAAADSSEAASSTAGGRSTPGAQLTRARQAEIKVQISQACGDDSKEVAGWPIDRIEQAVSPTDDQRHLLDDLANASVRAAQVIKETCLTNASFAPTWRLDAMQRRIEGVVQANDIVAAPLDKFYASLNDEQKARLNAANEQTGKSNSVANCGAASSATQWPADRIEKAVRPNEQQQAKLDALKTAMSDAAAQLAKSCPSSLPLTPPARLKAISMRLGTMLTVTKNVRAALDDFYNSLSDEQKAQLDLVGRQQTAQKQS
jgi:hypothetical protein